MTIAVDGPIIIPPWPTQLWIMTTTKPRRIRVPIHPVGRVSEYNRYRRRVEVRTYIYCIPAPQLYVLAHAVSRFHPLTPRVVAPPAAASVTRVASPAPAMSTARVAAPPTTPAGNTRH